MTNDLLKSIELQMQNIGKTIQAINDCQKAKTSPSEYRKFNKNTAIYTRLLQEGRLKEAEKFKLKWLAEAEEQDAKKDKKDAV